MSVLLCVIEKERVRQCTGVCDMERDSACVGVCECWLVCVIEIESARVIE